MTNQEILNLFDNNFDDEIFRSSFPDFEITITELEDGQQEIIVRVQGIDPGFKPSKDLQNIEVMGIEDVTISDVKNAMTLAREKRKKKQQRLEKRNEAFLKRAKDLAIKSGIDLCDLPGLMKTILPKEEVI